jgi:hypothetical protein
MRSADGRKRLDGGPPPIGLNEVSFRNQSPRIQSAARYKLTRPTWLLYGFWRAPFVQARCLSSKRSLRQKGSWTNDNADEKKVKVVK